MEPMQDEGGWPAPNKDDYLYMRPKGNGYVNYDKVNHIMYKLMNTNPKLGERNFKCATYGCQVKIKTDINNKVKNVVVSKKKKDQPFLPPVLPVHHHDNNAKEIKMFEIVHEEMQYGLKSYMTNGLRKIISAITFRCGGDSELLAFRPSDQEISSRWYRASNKYLDVSFRCL